MDEIWERMTASPDPWFLALGVILFVMGAILLASLFRR